MVHRGDSKLLSQKRCCRAGQRASGINPNSCSQWAGWAGRSAPARRCCRSKTRSSLGWRSWHRCRRKNAAAADTPWHPAFARRRSPAGAGGRWQPRRPPGRWFWRWYPLRRPAAFWPGSVQCAPLPTLAIDYR